MPCRERRIIPNGLNSRLLAPAPAFPFSPSCRHQSAAHHSVVLGTNSRPQQTCRLRLLKIFVRITKACSRAVIRLSKITHSMRANARRPLAAINPVKPSWAEPRETARLEEASDTAAVDEATARTTRRFAVESQPRRGIQ